MKKIIKKFMKKFAWQKNFSWLNGWREKGVSFPAALIMKIKKSLKRIKGIKAEPKWHWRQNKANLRLIAAFLAFGVLLGGGHVLYTGIANHLWQTVSGGTQLVPICRVANVPGKVGLSFDVAWGEDQTEKILELLDIYQVKATFFVTNTWMSQYPELTKAISSHGHELALHSATHPYFSDLSKDGMIKELTENNKLLNQLTGQQGKFFRPPFGDYNNNVLAVADQFGFITVCWAVDGGDWQNISARKIAKNVIEKTQPGDIVMLQNNNPQTVTALQEILNTWQQKNYLPVPLGSMVLQEEYFVDYDGVQKGSPSAQ